MATIVSAIYSADNQFFSNTSIVIESVNTHMERSMSSCFVLTDFQGTQFVPFSANIITYSISWQQSAFSRQFKLMSLANQMFKGTKPISGKELKILRHTASKLISKNPTSLHIR